MNFHALVVMTCTLVSLELNAAEGKPERYMPFICHDAVVRESSAKMVLAGKEKPAVIIPGKASADASEKFNDGQIEKAAKTLET